MEILWMILIGAVVGFLGQLLSGRAVHWLLSIIIGIVGVFIGFYLWGAIGDADNTIMGYVMGVIVAAVIVAIVGATTSRRSRA